MKDKVCELKCNIDDMTAEEIAFASERLMDEGAKDVTVGSVVMKKGRPAYVLTVMCSDDEKEKERFIGLIFRYTSTIGIREIISERYILERSSEELETPYGTVRFKRVKGYGTERIKPEYDDLALIAKQKDISISDARELVLTYIHSKESMRDNEAKGREDQ